ncbi:hypothetical protein BJP40_06390 [Streptomyces sp. CC53]|uniref:hypothetical protein n=1 Tax=Streptomyces sp. CC53 TaxID=1906740 RepID=UPI0008DD6E56|nr:hypothetical protein [Streptomyces sp. CC53]OII61151.1 hypothetical protein BJP40_06390 [Streptomyces sp. CC53]
MTPDDPDDFYRDDTPPPRRKSEPMEGFAAELAGRIRELFFQYTNRLDRSQQKHLGPSEIGTPCDRRLAMSLMGMPAVNPGGDNWASWKGTQIHRGLAEMIDWANANSGRYATEMRVALPSERVPGGTLDWLDRTLLMVGDWKLLGSSSLSKLRLDGPPPRYRIQAHCYGLGATRAGERIEHVAIIGMPAEAQSLNSLYVWAEPYSEQVALDALARVDRIAEQIGTVGNGRGEANKRLLALAFPTADDCKFCSWHTKTKSGCNGHQS